MLWKCFFSAFPGLFYLENEGHYDSQTIGGIRDVFRGVCLWISYQSAMMAYMPVPCNLDIISDYLPSKPENQKVQGSFLNGWPLPTTLLGNKPLSAVSQSTECRTYDVDQVSDVWMKNRSLYAKYPEGTYNMIAAIYFQPPWPRPLIYTLAVD